MAELKVYGTHGCSRCLMVRKILDSKNKEYDYILIEDLNKIEKDSITDLAQSIGQQSFPLLVKNNQIIKLEEV